jgi:hypothetical protein
VPAEKLYMIDKVVRKRGLQGRFGVDHSEILNFEFEMANKNRSDHMNRLVYRGEYDPYTEDTQGGDFALEADKENTGGHLSSTILFKRLT